MPLIPLHDTTPRTFIRQPWLTWGVIVTCGVIYMWQAGLHPVAAERVVLALGVIPATLVGDAQLAPDLYLVPPFWTLFTSMFLHGSFMHLAGNMLYLWVFGDNVEDAMGHGRYAVFYPLCGVIAMFTQVLADPVSVAPTIGASGAVSGILGAYLILHPKARVLVPIYIFPLYVPAYLLLLFWIGLQFLSAAADAGGAAQGGVAWWAHIGGFITGAVLIVLFRRKTVPLFGGDDPPRGVRLAARPRRSDDRRRRGPWE